MSDKERIERLLMTLMHLQNCMIYLSKMTTSQDIKDAINGVRHTINEVLEANADQIKTDL